MDALVSEEGNMVFLQRRGVEDGSEVAVSSRGSPARFWMLAVNFRRGSL